MQNRKWKVGKNALSGVYHNLLPPFYFLFSIFYSLIPCLASAQPHYWQQHVSYEMRIDLDHKTHRFRGTQKLTYTNHSPDTLHRVYYHLYFNAFQPGSAMDVRSRTIADPDERIGSRIAALKPSEVGFHHIDQLTQDGQPLTVEVQGTVMVVALARPILPNQSAVFEMSFNSQVPVQIRRSGRDNKEGVDYTMTQWYPKMAEYDVDGWHTDTYIGREFHGVFGDFEVEITLEENYVVGGTGVLVSEPAVSNGRKTWRFRAENVHDFAWAADPAFVHKKAVTARGTQLNFYHLDDEKLHTTWNQMMPKAVEMFDIMDATFGAYPYPQFSVIQGGDGGMEYPMCTMIVGSGSLGGLTSVTVHEAIHNWFYGVLATNELKYPWMDEGFTTYAQNLVLDSINRRSSYNPHQRSYQGYLRYLETHTEEPLTTHADCYERNSGYANAAYSKGCVFLNQLRYIVGDEVFYRGMKRYFAEWGFRHPTPTDFKRVMEKESGLELDWYFEGWIGTTKQIDYAIANVESDGRQTKVVIARVGAMPMPLNVAVVTEKDSAMYYIPLESMRGTRQYPAEENVYTEKPWPWVYPVYELTIDEKRARIKSIIIDPRKMLADVNRNLNIFPAPEETAKKPE